MFLNETGSKARAGLYFQADAGGGEGGGGEKPWLTNVPEEYRGHEAIAGLDNHADVYKNLIELHGQKASFNGEGMVRVPGEGASAEDIAAFNKAIGIPEDFKAYELPDLKLPETMKPEDLGDWPDAFKQMAHEAGLNAKQAANLYKSISQANIDAQATLDAERAKALDEATTGMKGEWKGDYDKNLESATRALKTLGGDEFAKFLDESGLGNRPEMIRFGFALSQKISEASAAPGGGGSGDGVRKMADGTPFLSFGGKT